VAVSIVDKLSGRVKQIFGRATGDPETRRQGLREEQKGEAKAEEAAAERQAERRREEVSDLERRT
jgi:uncharacterized protein YjbJ (UPF0337 family)